MLSPVGRVAGVTLLVVSAVAGCATQPLQAAQPSRSAGLSVDLVGQRCDRENDPSWSVADILNLALEMRFSNQTSAPAWFDPASVHLLAAGAARPAHEADAAQLVEPGTTRVFRIRFLDRDDRLACNVNMALDLSGAARLQARPVSLPRLPFVPSRDDI